MFWRLKLSSGKLGKRASKLKRVGCLEGGGREMGIFESVYKLISCGWFQELDAWN